MISSIQFIRRCLSGAAVALMLAQPASAVELAKAVTLKIGGVAAGGSDTAGRIVAKYLPNYLPGTPALQVENVAGGDGVVLQKQMATSQAADGSVLGFDSTTVKLADSRDELDFDPSTMKMVGSLASNVPICITRKDAKLDLSNPATKFGAQAATSGNYLAAAFIRHIKQGKFQIVTGYKSYGELAAATERGEIDAYCGVSYATFLREKRDATLAIPFAFGSTPELKARGAGDILEGLTGDDAAVGEHIVRTYVHFFYLYLPGATDDGVLAIYRDAFRKLVADKAFQQEMEAAKIILEPTQGEELQAFFDAAYKIDPKLLEQLKALRED